MSQTAKNQETKMHTFKDKELKKQYVKQRKERKEQREAKRNGG